MGLPALPIALQHGYDERRNAFLGRRRAVICGFLPDRKAIRNKGLAREYPGV
jgi:hypothetical protein